MGGNEGNLYRNVGNGGENVWNLGGNARNVVNVGNGLGMQRIRVRMWGIGVGMRGAELKQKKRNKSL